MVDTNFIVDTIAIIIVLLMLLNGRQDWEQLSQRRFIRLVSVIGLTLIADVLCRALEHTIGNDARFALMLVNSVISMLQMLCSLCWVLYMRLYIKLPIIKNTHRNIMMWLPFVIEGLLMICNFKWAMIFDITPELGYVRKEWFVANYIFGLVYTAYAFIIIIREIFIAKDNSHRKNCIYMFLYMLLPIIAFLAQLKIFDLNMTMPLLSVSALMVYLQVQQKQVSLVKAEAIKAKAEYEKTQALMDQKQEALEEAQRTNRTIRYQKELLDNVYATMNAGIIRNHIGRDFQSTEIMNQAAIKLCGFNDYSEYNQNMIDGRLFNMDAEDACALHHMIGTLQKIWNRNECDCKIFLKDGAIRILHFVNTLISEDARERVVQSIIYDVTEIRKEEAVKAKEHRDAYLNEIFDILATDTSDAYILLDGESYSVEYVSPNIERLTGLSIPDIKGDLSVLYSDDVCQMDIYQELELVKRENISPRLVKRIHAQNKEERYYSECYYIQRLHADSKIVMVISDRTDDIVAKQALEEALRNAEVANRAKTDFLSDMSHDIRTPMNAIIGLIELLKEDVGHPENAMRHLRALEMSGDHMLELVNNVLDMSRIEKGSMILNIIPFDIQEMISEVQAVYHAQASYKNIKVHDSLNVKSKMLMGDMVRVKKILMNLLSNAVKYTNEGGSIYFSIDELEGNTPAGHATVQFKVKDTGIGMSKEFMNDLFRLFAREYNTTTSGIMGTGLGLPIVKTLVDLMGGVIQVESEQGSGSEFTVVITFKLDENHRNVLEEEIEKEEDSIDLSGMHFLIVEDNPVNAEIILELLNLQGVNCDLAINGKEACEMFEVSAPYTYDLILMDVQMPVMNGYEATRTIRESSHPQAKNIPIIAMTANAFIEDVNNALDAGMNAHMAKPLKMEVIKTFIANQMNKKI